MGKRKKLSYEDLVDESVELNDRINQYIEERVPRKSSVSKKERLRFAQQALTPAEYKRLLWVWREIGKRVKTSERSRKKLTDIKDSPLVYPSRTDRNGTLDLEVRRERRYLRPVSYTHLTLPTN